MKFTEEQRFKIESKVGRISASLKGLTISGNRLFDEIESILSPLPHQDGASAEDVLMKSLKDLGWTGSLSYDNKVIILKAMHQFAQSETAKVVAEKDREVAKRTNDIDHYIKLSTIYVTELSAKIDELSAANARIAELEQGISNWVRVSNERQEELNRVEAELNNFKTMRTDPVFINNVCLSYNHSFGLMPIPERNAMQFDCAEWMRAILNNIDYKTK